jgi:hypothetical protein
MISYNIVPCNSSYELINATYRMFAFFQTSPIYPFCQEALLPVADVGRGWYLG